MVADAPPAQPCTVPSSVTKMNKADFPDGNMKSAGLPLNITPVGDPNPCWLGALRMDTIPLPLMGTMFAVNVPFVTVIEYSVDVPPALLETHHGVPLGKTPGTT